MAASAPVKNIVSIDCTLKKLFPATKHSNAQGKNVFLRTTALEHSLFSWVAISLKFLCICQ